MRIALMEEEHIPDVIRMAREFHSNSPHSATPFEERKVEELCDKLKGVNKDGVILVLIDDFGLARGVLGAVAIENIFNYERMAGELMWWVDPEVRGNSLSGDLIVAFEDWARYAGCKRTVLASLADSRVGSYYKRKGYQKIEDSWIKEI